MKWSLRCEDLAYLAGLKGLPFPGYERYDVIVRSSIDSSSGSNFSITKMAL